MIYVLCTYIIFNSWFALSIMRDSLLISRKSASEHKWELRAMSIVERVMVFSLIWQGRLLIQYQDGVALAVCCFLYCGFGSWTLRVVLKFASVILILGYVLIMYNGKI